MGHEENTKEDEELMPERKRRQLHEGAYRIVFNDKDKVSTFHTKINVRDRSLDNFHGDADMPNPQLRPSFAATE